MERQIIIGVVAASLLAIALAIFLPGGRTPDEFPKLPWKIDLNPDGSTRVFGLTLGTTLLSEAQEVLGAEAKINLFAAPSGSFAIEAYFERLFLSGIKADLVLTLDIPQAEAEQMFQRGLRVSTLGSGARKVALAPQDKALTLRTPISHIAYLPTANLDAELIANLFGEPERKIAEAKGVTHWLYPDKGLDIALNPDGREVFQYVLPAQFSRLVTPLQQARPGLAAPVAATTND